MHFNFQQPVAGAGLAAAALHIEGEPVFLIATNLGLRKLGKHPADQVKQPGIRGGIGPGRPADRRLVNIDDLIQLFLALQTVKIRLAGPGAVQIVGQRAIQNGVNQAAFPAAGHACDAAEHPQRDPHINVFEVMLPRAVNRQPALGHAPGCGHGDAFAAGQILAGDGFGGVDNILHRALGHHMAAVLPGSGANIHQIIRAAQGFLIVLHHDQGVPQLPQMAHGGQQPGVIPLMQADGGLIQNIQHAHQPAADLGGQTDTLGLAARQRGRGPGQGQVIQPHIAQKAQPRVNLPQDGRGDHAVLFGKGEPVEKHPGFADIHRADLGDVLLPHRHRQRFGLQPQPMAGRAGFLRHILLVGSLHSLALGLPVSPFQRGNHALIGGLIIAGFHFDFDFLAAGAIEDFFAHILRQLPEGGIHGEAEEIRQRLKHHMGGGIALAAVPAHAVHGPLIQGFARIGHHQLLADLLQHAQAAAHGACAIRVIEREHPGGQLFDIHAAVRAGVVLRKEHFVAIGHDLGRGQAAGFPHGGFQAVGQTLLNTRAHHQPVYHNIDLVLFLFVQRGHIVQLIHVPINAHADKPGLSGVLQQLHMLALPGAHHRGHQLKLGALRQGHHGVGHLVHGLLLDFLAAFGAMGRAHPGIHQAHIIVNFRHGAHGGPGIAGGSFLVDGDGGRQALDAVHIGLIHLAQELPGVAAHALHISPLALSVNRVKRQRGFSRARQPRKHHQLVPRNGDIHVFQVMLPRPAHNNLIFHLNLRYDEVFARGTVPWRPKSGSHRTLFQERCIGK